MSEEAVIVQDTEVPEVIEVPIVVELPELRIRLKVSYL